MSAMGISIDWKWTDYQVRVRDELKTGAVTLPASANALLNELEVYEYDKTESGRVRYSAPSGFHDDCVDALALAVEAAASGGEKTVRRRSGGTPTKRNLMPRDRSDSSW